jgi:hypothetical protein
MRCSTTRILTFTFFQPRDSVLHGLFFIRLIAVPKLSLRLPPLHQSAWDPGLANDELQDRNDPAHENNISPATRSIALHTRRYQSCYLSRKDAQHDRQLIEDPDGAAVRCDNLVDGCL